MVYQGSKANLKLNGYKEVEKWGNPVVEQIHH